MKTTSKTSFQSKTEISQLIAANLLKQNRRLSFTEIESLPLVQGRNDVDEIVKYLQRTMHAQRIVVKKDDYPILRWDTVLVISDLQSQD